MQAVPTVFAVIGGQLVPGFEGVLPDDQLREFIGAVLQAAAQAGLQGPGMPAEAGEGDEPQLPEDPRFDAAEEALADGDYDLAKQRFQAILDVEPANSAASSALHQVNLLERISSYPATTAEPGADDVAGQLAAADLAFASDDVDGALRRLLDVLAAQLGRRARHGARAAHRVLRHARHRRPARAAGPARDGARPVLSRARPDSVCA